jgi:hypothetical protein
VETPADLRRIGAVEAFERVEERFPESKTLALVYAEPPSTISPGRHHQKR